MYFTVNVFFIRSGVIKHILCVCIICNPRLETACCMDNV